MPDRSSKQKARRLLEQLEEKGIQIRALTTTSAGARGPMRHVINGAFEPEVFQLFNDAMANYRAVLEVLAERDENQSAAAVLRVMQARDIDAGREAPAAVLGRMGGLKGGKARAEKLSKKRRSEIAKAAAKARWKT